MSIDSKLLQQSIADAAALREAALKSAENTLIEQHSQEIREMVKTLLEADFGLDEEEDGPFSGGDPMGGDDEMGDMGGAMGDDMAMGMDTGTEVDSPVMDELPYAHDNGTKNCSCPDEDDEITIDFDELSAASMGDDIQFGEPDGGMDDMDGGNPDQMGGDLDSADGFDMGGDEDDDDKLHFAREHVEKLKSSLMFEKLNFRVDTLVKEQLDATLNPLAKQIKQLMKENKLHLEQKQKYSKAVKQINEKVDKLVLDNAKLLYTNRVLRNDSLNERQKEQIAENISNARSPEEAKTIYETLQKTVGSTKRKEPKSLSEAIHRRSAGFIKPINEATDPLKEKMQRLAGIKKK